MTDKAPADIGALVAEVERLRDVNDGYLLEMGRQHALLRYQKRGENAERAAVDAYLRAPDEPNELDDLRVEVEHLRSEVERLRGEVDAERAAVVKWLRAEAVAFAGTRTEQGVQRAKSLALVADNIERGEHRREGGK